MSASRWVRSTCNGASAPTVDLPVSMLSNHTHVALPVHVVHGEEEGP